MCVYCTRNSGWQKEQVDADTLRSARCSSQTTRADGMVHGAWCSAWLLRTARYRNENADVQISIVFPVFFFCVLLWLLVHSNLVYHRTPPTISFSNSLRHQFRHHLRSTMYVRNKYETLARSISHNHDTKSNHSKKSNHQMRGVLTQRDRMNHKWLMHANGHELIAQQRWTVSIEISRIAIEKEDNGIK